ncbi:MAG: alpha/beta fold hydrolase [Chthoniobacterales bacterium]
MRLEVAVKSRYLKTHMKISLRLIALVCLLILGLSAKTKAADELKRRGFLGVQTGPVESGSNSGAKITYVWPGGFAAASGLKVGDIITSLNGKKVNAPNALDSAIRTVRTGDRATLQYQREGKLLTAEGVLPEQPRESYASADVIYDFVAGAKGQRLRTIITKPKNVQGKLPVIFLAGWLSDDSVEAPNETGDPSGLVSRGLAQLPGFATFRVDKPGSGDSEGDCAETDFDTELAGYRAAFAALARYDFIDTNRIFIFGVSNGGGFAPIVPPTPADLARVRGFVVVGGWVKTWLEHMLEIERSRLALDGKSPGEVNTAMKELAGFYDDLLIRGEKPAQLFERRQAATKIWPGDDLAHLYGRPIAFYQQLQKLNLADAWSKVNVPTLVVHGQFDWIMSRENSELIASIVNTNRPGAAEFIELPNTGHTFQNYPSLQAAFKNQQQPFNPALAKRVADWFVAHRDR